MTLRTLLNVGLFFLATALPAQSFNIGAGVVRSEGLGFDEYYGSGLIEVNGATDSLIYRFGIELLDSEKKGQNGWGGRVDITLTKPLSGSVGVIAFYRPSFIDQTDYTKAAHQVGIGAAFVTEKNGRWDIFYGVANDEYSQQSIGAEFRYGSGHWLRVKTEYIRMEHPESHNDLSGSRISITIAPRIK